MLPEELLVEEIGEKKTPKDAQRGKDSVRLYLKEMGRIPLLTREQELALARAIESAEQSYRSALFELPGIQRAILRLMERIVQGDSPIDNPFRTYFFSQEQLVSKALGVRKKLEKALDPAKVKRILENAGLGLALLEWIDRSIPGASQDKIEERKMRYFQAKQALVEANLRLVISIAKKYAHGELSLLDLIQEGNLGLIRAVEKFDYKKGFRFSTYATWWIRQAIARATAELGRTIRIPIHMNEALHKMERARHALAQEKGGQPTPEELGRVTKFSESRLLDLMAISQKPLSLEAAVAEDRDTQLGDLLEDRNAPSPAALAAASFLKEEIRNILDTLSDRERRIVMLRFGLEDGCPHPLEEIGKMLHVSQEKVRHLEMRALNYLRHSWVTEPSGAGCEMKIP
ncbi:MAG: sigma-70 family RNA polymerase sigma factor [Candidatus Omnitrophica bacterium]|nr:sigma-70 family RNA polymerase sigma factor [Candidatus Omnitrophota bacterium]